VSAPAGIRSAEHGSVRGGAHELDVLAEHTLGKGGRKRLPPVLAAGELLVVHEQIEGLVRHIEADLVAVADERDRPTVDGLGGDVPDAQAGGSPGDAAVGEGP